MFRKVLVPVDFTEKNETALQIAADLVGKGAGGPAEVTLLHVIETINHVEFEELADFYRGLEERAGAKLAEMEKRFAGTDVAVRSHVLYGKRAEEIVRFGEGQGCGLIVLSSHPVEPDRPALGVGTISYRIAILARCPVLLVK